MSLGPLYVLLEEVSVQVLYQFFNWIVFLVLSSNSFLCILESNGEKIGTTIIEQ